MKKNKKKYPKLPKFDYGGIQGSLRGKGVGNMANYLLDNALTTTTGGLGANIIKQDQYNDTQWGRTIGTNQSMKEQFDGMQPTAKIGKKFGLYQTDQESTGMNDQQYAEYQKWQPVAEMGSKVGEAWATQGMGGAGSMFNMFKKKDKPEQSGSGQADYINQQRQDQFQEASPQDVENMWQQKYPMGGKIQYANGGTGNISAEVEGGETSISPDSQFTEYEGPDHNNGGIKTDLAQGAEIFTKRFGPNGKKGPSFAKLSEPLGKALNKAKKAIDSGKFTKTHELNFMGATKAIDNLFNYQEQSKLDKVNNYAKKLGLDISQGLHMMPDGNMMSNSEMYPNGGLYPGYSNPYSKFKGSFPAWKNGGIQKFDGGGTYKGKQYLDDYSLQNALRADGDNRSLLQYRTDNYNSMIANESEPTMDAPSNYVSPTEGRIAGGPSKESILAANNIPNYTSDTEKSDQPTISNNQEDPNTNSRGFKFGNFAKQVGLFGAQNAGNIYDLVNRQKPEVTKYERLTPNLVSDKEALRGLDISELRAARDLKNTVKGNVGTYLSNRLALATQKGMNKAAVSESTGNINAGILNNIDAINKEIGRLELEKNKQARAKGRSTTQSAIADMGKNTIGQYKDYKADKYDQTTLDNMKYLYDALEKDPILKERWMKIQRGYK